MAGITIADVTSRVLAEFNNNVPDGRPPREAQRKVLLPNNNEWPLPTWDLPRHAGYHYFADPPVDEQTGKLRFVTRSIIPETMEFVFEITGISIPKLVAVSWPLTLYPRRDVAVPFLVYYRPEPIPEPLPATDRLGPSYTEICHKAETSARKGCALYNVKPYPWSWDFLFYVFWNYLNYRSDPLTYNDERWRPNRSHLEANHLSLTETDEKFSFGLPYQLQASRKPMVLVLPMAGPRTFAEFEKASVVQETLEAIQDFVFRRVNVQPPPPVSWVAIAGYSKSNKTIGRFLTQNRDHPLVARTIKEVYLFDPAPVRPEEEAAKVDAAIRSVKDWALRGSEFKAIRAYASQMQFPAFTEILGGPLPEKPAFRDTRLGVQVGNTARSQTFPWSVAWLPTKAWPPAQAAAREADYQRRREQWLKDLTAAHTLEEGQNTFNMKWALDDQQEYDKENKMGGKPMDVHLALAATCLTDAARRNSFNYAPYNLRPRRSRSVDATTPRRVLAGI